MVSKSGEIFTRKKRCLLCHLQNWPNTVTDHLSIGPPKEFGINLSTSICFSIHSYTNIKDEPISRDLSLRITAIRETFEESGILLLEKNGQLIKSSDLPNKNEIKQWRNAVEADASKFLDMCKELGACPKVDQLYEWSNWLTPPGILPKRFDTAFYLTNIPEIPDYAAEDGGETVHFAVMNPFEALSKSLKSEIILHPPQFTELSRIAKAYSLEVLIDYASNRQQRGIKRWCPNQIFFKGIF